jgi:electron transport complex protein RnfC
MLITQMKDKESILSLITGKVFIINCHGCKEVSFPEQEPTPSRRSSLPTAK